MPETSHTHSVRERFSHAAPSYDTHSGVQKDVAAHVAGLLSDVPAPERILEVGCGSGQLTHHLVRLFPEAQIEAIDISDRMVAAAKEQLGDRVRFDTADAATFSNGKSYPLIISSSSLHWMFPLEATFQNLAAQLDQTGQFVFGLMLEGTLLELHTSRLVAVPSKPPRARLPNEAKVYACLQRAGLEVIDAGRDSVTRHYDSARAVLQRIHAQGLTGGYLSHGTRPLTRSELSRLISHYDAHYADERGGVQATYRMLYVKARKADPLPSP